jgi:formylglycine-generating enzyme required for sulfatase activity
MIVVKSGEAFSTPFAISRSEISVANYNLYCNVTNACTNLTQDNNLPATGLSLTSINAYADWLTSTTGNTYRLPTETEWEYAADAGGKTSKKGANCRILKGSKVIKGGALLDIRTGSTNSWGMKNVIGNAQELVMSGTSAVARGGSYDDSHSKCSVTMRVAINSTPDDKTGFRLIQIIN